MNIDKIIREEIVRLNETAGKNMPDAFFDQVVQKLGGTPTEEKRKFFRAWKQAEGTNAKNNPLATTWDKQVPGQTDFNDVGVKNYPDQETGISATVNTLTKGIGASAYRDLVTKLQSDMTAEDLANTPSAFKSWSGKPNYVADVLGSKQTTDIEQSTDSREKQDPDPDWKTILDYFQFGLDIAGIIPFYGDILDIINAIIYVTRANVEDNDTYYIDAALSSIAIIPAVGSAVALPLKAMIKGLRKFPGGTKTLKKALKNVDDSESWSAVFSSARQNNLIDPKTLNVLSTKMRDVNKIIISRTDKISKQFGIPITLLQKPRQRVVGLLDAMAAGAAKERRIAAAATTTKLDLPNWAKNIISAPIKLAKLSVLAPLKTLSGYRKVVGADTKSIVNVASGAFDNKFLFKGGFERFIETYTKGSGVAKIRTKLPDLLKKLNVDAYKSNMSPAQARKELSDLFRQYEKRSPKDRKNLVNDFTEWAKNTDVADGIQAQDYINALRKSYVSKQFGLGNLTRSNFIPTFKESFQRLKNSGGRVLVENLNVFKIIPRLLRDAPVLSNSDNEIVASIGDMLGNMAYKLWESTGAIAILKSMEPDSPGYDEQKEESKQAAKEFMQIKEEVIETVKQIPDGEYNELTEEEQKILQEILVFD